MIGNHLERIRHQYTSRMNSMIKLDCDKDKHQLSFNLPNQYYSKDRFFKLYS